MRDCKLAGCLIFLLAFCLAGCASLHVDIGPTVGWDEVSRVILQEPAEDSWQLSPAIRAELQDMGLTVLTDENVDPDLLVRFSYEEGPDLNPDGDLLTRLKSLHIQFVDPATDQNLAVVDYFYAQNQAEKPLDGVKAAFAGVRQDILTSAIAQPQPAPAPVSQSSPDTPVATPAMPQKEAAAAVVSPATAPQSLVGSKSTTPSQRPAQESASPEQQSFHAAPVNRSVDQVRSTEEATGVTAPTVQAPAKPVHDRVKPEMREIAPKTESPWIPRFQSWGFENWGEQPDDGY